MYFIVFFSLLFYIGSVNKDVTEQENKLSKSASTYLYRNFGLQDDFFIAKNGGKFRAHASSPTMKTTWYQEFFQHTHYHVVGDRGCENTSKNPRNYNVRNL